MGYCKGSRPITTVETGASFNPKKAKEPSPYLLALRQTLKNPGPATMAQALLRHGPRLSLRAFLLAQKQNMSSFSPKRNLINHV